MISEKWHICGFTQFDTSWDGQTGMSLLWIKSCHYWYSSMDYAQLPVWPYI